MVPERIGTSLKKIFKAALPDEQPSDDRGGEFENIRKLREIYNGNDMRAQVLKEAERLEGNVRNMGIHAAGIIIAPKDLTELHSCCHIKRF